MVIWTLSYNLQNNKIQYNKYEIILLLVLSHNIYSSLFNTSSMKLGTMINSNNSINELSSLQMKPLQAYKLTLFLNEIQKELDSFNQIRTKLIEKYWKKDDKWVLGINGKDIEALEKFNKDLEPILDQEIKTKIPTIKISDIESNLKPSMLLNLTWLIKE